MIVQVKDFVPGKLYRCFDTLSRESQHQICSFFLYKNIGGWDGRPYTGEFMFLQFRTDLRWANRGNYIALEVLTARAEDPRIAWAGLQTRMEFWHEDSR